MLLLFGASLQTLAQVQFGASVGRNISPDLQFVDLNVQLSRFSPQPSFRIVGNGDIAITANVQALDIDRATIIQHGPYSAQRNPQIYDTLRLVRGAGNYIVLSWRVKWPNDLSNAPFIPTGGNDATVAVIRVPIRPGSCGRPLGVRFMTNTSDGTSPQARRVGCIITDIADSSGFNVGNAQPLSNAINWQIPANEIEIGGPAIPVQNLAIVGRNPNSFDIRWQDNNRNSRARRFYIQLFPEGLATPIRIEGPAATNATNATTLTTYDQRIQMPVVGGRQYPRGTFRVCTVGWCGDSICTDPQPYEIENCPPFDFPESAINVTPNTSTNGICYGQTLRIDVALSQIRYNRGGVFSPITWRETGNVSTDGGTTWWPTRNIIEIPNFWATLPLSQNSATFRIMVRDANECRSEVRTIVVNINRPSSANSRPVLNKNVPGTLCSNVLQRLNYTRQGDQNISYVWRTTVSTGRFLNAAGQPAAPGATEVFYNPGALASGTHRIYIENACFGPAFRDSLEIIYQTASDPKFEIIRASNLGVNKVLLDEPVTIRVTNHQSNAQNVQYQYDLGTGDFTQTGNAQDLLTSFNTIGSRRIRVRASVPGGCVADSILNLEVVTNQVLFVPNVFAPIATNAENATFKVYAVNVSAGDFQIVVMNRWGEVVFATDNLSEATNQGWNGKKNNSGEDCPSGSYTYGVKGKYADGTVFEKSGVVSLLR